ncbi:hypothetical protein [Bradyrhizobium sp. RDI18]|uniref:hypothetical protein n=1 Tax=Bradyrhizobium sp. RDI18 TaxID=3367400 RepID=UPI0037241423
MEHAQAFEPIQDGRIYIEKINGPFLFGDKGTAAEYRAGLDYAVERGWLTLHESGLSSPSHPPAQSCLLEREKGNPTNAVTSSSSDETFLQRARYARSVNRHWRISDVRGRLLLCLRRPARRAGFQFFPAGTIRPGPV